MACMSLQAISICIYLLITLPSITCAAIDPWPTINASPQYITRNVVRTPSADEIDTSTCRCKFFIWDILSYIKYGETNRLIRKNTYEGLGGRKFVRVQPGGYFERWMPQLRGGKLKKDACWLCGYSFRDHLEYWSGCKRTNNGGKQSAFDSYLDTFNKMNTNRASGYSFHQRYVEEVQPNKRLKKNGKVIRESEIGGVSYLIPPFNPISDDGRPKKPWTAFMLVLARVAALERVDDLIWFSKVESSTKQQQL